MIEQVPALPRFSVITVVLNDQAGLRKTRLSLQSQIFPSKEWIVVDGGSTDGTLLEIDQVSDIHHICISGPDSGIYEAMNKGLGLASGEYVIFMNSGDRFANDDVLGAVDKALSANNRSPTLIFGDAYEELQDGQMLFKPARSARAIVYGMFTHHQAMFYRRSVAGRLKYNTYYKIAGDYDLTCRVLKESSDILRMQFPICIFARGGLSSKKAKLGRQEALKVQKEALGLSRIYRMVNYAAFISSNILRTYFPHFYDMIRFRTKPI